MELESYAFVLLRRGPNADDFSEAECERLQAAHLAHLDAMAAAGKLAGAGPFSDQLRRVAARALLLPLRASKRRASSPSRTRPSRPAG